MKVVQVSAALCLVVVVACGFTSAQNAASDAALAAAQKAIDYYNYALGLLEGGLTKDEVVKGARVALDFNRDWIIAYLPCKGTRPDQPAYNQTVEAITQQFDQLFDKFNSDIELLDETELKVKVEDDLDDMIYEANKIIKYIGLNPEACE
ncbi:hypothetical protein EGW08_019695 [Elysia chlorotica]|uniref:Uncharacterized protein n=1 Tax=Elysia chlorotica TaxID=188477 RepID=A0A3S1AUJ1_ELYCH|nr:hypothetical protein EGW08_019695 [Elysia chlorotica]